MEVVDDEIWLAVVDFYGLYEVSSKSRVQSLDRITNGPTPASRTVKGRVLRQFIPEGHKLPWVCLARNGKKYPRRVDRLVREAFGEQRKAAA